MRPVPIPDGVAERMGGQRVVIGEPGDPTRDDVRPCEYVMGRSTIYEGRPVFAALIELDDHDRELIAGGAKLWLQLDGGEVAWSLEVAEP